MEQVHLRGFRHQVQGEALEIYLVIERFLPINLNNLIKFLPSWGYHMHATLKNNLGIVSFTLFSCTEALSEIPNKYRTAIRFFSNLNLRDSQSILFYLEVNLHDPIYVIGLLEFLGLCQNMLEKFSFLPALQYVLAAIGCFCQRCQSFHASISQGQVQE